MRQIGQVVGLGLSVLFSTAVAAAFHALSDGGIQAGESVLAGLVFCGTSAPLAWWLGGRYDRMKAWAERDALTNAFTRRYLRQGYLKLVKPSDRKRKRMAILLIDVDDFKSINDSYGHARGDELLCKLANGLASAARQGEIVSRWGGDEFVILCPNGDSQSLDRLKKRIEERIEPIAAHWKRPLSVSVGAAVYPDDGRLLEELVQAADRRMYADKSSGKIAVSQRLQA